MSTQIWRHVFLHPSASRLLSRQELFIGPLPASHAFHGRGETNVSPKCERWSCETQNLVSVKNSREKLSMWLWPDLSAVYHLVLCSSLAHNITCTESKREGVEWITPHRQTAPSWWVLKAIELWNSWTGWFFSLRPDTYKSSEEGKVPATFLLAATLNECRFLFV